MTKITVYTKGDPGFMPAIIVRLGRDAIHSGRDIGDGIVSFSLPENQSIDDFKAAIGTDLIADFNMVFFEDPPPATQEEATWKFVPGRPFKISIWTNNDSILTGSKAKASGEIKP